MIKTFNYSIKNDTSSGKRQFIKKKDKYWKKLGFRCMVTRQRLEQVCEIVRLFKCNKPVNLSVCLSVMSLSVCPFLTGVYLTFVAYWAIKSCHVQLSITYSTISRCSLYIVSLIVLVLLILSSVLCLFCPWHPSATPP